jgi:hypothetical protein
VARQMAAAAHLELRRPLASQSFPFLKPLSPVIDKLTARAHSPPAITLHNLPAKILPQAPFCVHTAFI